MLILPYPKLLSGTVRLVVSAPLIRYCFAPIVPAGLKGMLYSANKASIPPVTADA